MSTAGARVGGWCARPRIFRGARRLLRVAQHFLHAARWLLRGARLLLRASAVFARCAVVVVRCSAVVTRCAAAGARGAADARARGRHWFTLCHLRLQRRDVGEGRRGGWLWMSWRRGPLHSACRGVQARTLGDLLHRGHLALRFWGSPLWRSRDGKAKRLVRCNCRLRDIGKRRKCNDCLLRALRTPMVGR